INRGWAVDGSVRRFCGSANDNGSPFVGIRTSMRNSLRTLTRCPDCILATIGAGFAFAIVALFVSDLSSGYDEAITAAKKTTRTYADTLALHTAHELEGVDRALRVAEIVRGNVAIRRPASWPGEAGPGQTAQDALRQVQQTSSLIVS